MAPSPRPSRTLRQAPAASNAAAISRKFSIDGPTATGTPNRAASIGL